MLLGIINDLLISNKLLYINSYQWSSLGIKSVTCLYNTAVEILRMKKCKKNEKELQKKKNNNKK